MTNRLDEKNTITILGCDPGGIRGAATASCIKHLNTSLDGGLLDNVDVFCGTSIGSFISAYLADGGDSRRLVDMFVSGELASSIFNKTWSYKMLQNVPVLNHFAMKYTGDNKQAFCKKFWGDRRISNVQKGLLITTYDITRRSPVFWNNFGDHPFDPLVSEVVDASTAAPSYFPPVMIRSSKIHGKEPEYYEDIVRMRAPHFLDYHVDGGVANHFPGILAYAMLKKKYPLKMIKLISIGTGFNTREIHHGTRSPMSWISNDLVGVLVDGPSQTLGAVSDIMLGSNFVRLNGMLTEEQSVMDNISEPNIQSLVNVGQEWAQKGRDEVRALLEM